MSRLLAAHSVHGAFSRSHGLCLPLLRPINGSERRANAPHVPVDARWRPLLVQASALKEALDHGLRWKGPHATDDWVRDVLAANGIDLDHARPLASEAALKCAFPDHFAQLLLGSWFRAGDEYRSVGWVTIPEWSVLGWVRKDQYRNTVLDSAATLRLKINGLERRVADAEAIGDSTAVGPTTHAIEGIPLFWAGEGKNRTQLYRLGQVPRTTPLHVYPRPKTLDGLRVRRVAGFKGLAALEFPRGDLEVLPFGDLSEAFLGALGVHLHSRPSVRAGLMVLGALHSAYGFLGLIRAVRSLSEVRLAYVLKVRARRPIFS